jgi:SAM-dependent methyltransferase
VTGGRTESEREFWDEAVSSLQDLIAAYRTGAQGSETALVEEFGPCRGRRVLDFGCGGGVLSAHLASHGAFVTASTSAPSRFTALARLADAAGMEATFVCRSLIMVTLDAASFAAVVGRWVLHHINVCKIAPVIAHILKRGGLIAFRERMGLNPTLRYFRKRVGHGPITKLGTDDEKPLGRRERGVRASVVGPIELHVKQMRFLRLSDRNVLRRRVKLTSVLLALTDDLLLRLGTGRWSSDQIAVARKPPEEPVSARPFSTLLA